MEQPVGRRDVGGASRKIRPAAIDRLEQQRSQHFAPHFRAAHLRTHHEIELEFQAEAGLPNIDAELRYVR